MTVLTWVASLGMWIVWPLAAVVFLLANWTKIENEFKKRFIGPAFRVRPIPGETLVTPPNIVAIARLAIANISGKPLKQVSVRLMAAYKILQTGELWDARCAYPSINPHRGETFLLRWGDGENSVGGRKFLDIPSDGAERIADCLILEPDNAGGFAAFATTDPTEVPNRLPGIGGNCWWKLEVLVADDAGTSEKTELVAFVSDRDPGPITLDLWRPRGEQIIEILREKFAKKERERKDARKRARETRLDSGTDRD